MKYMTPEWNKRLEHWLYTLRQDFYRPLGDIPVEAFRTMEQLSLEEASKGQFAPMPFGTRWGRSYEYCWMRGKITLPAEAEGKRIVMDLPAGGESALFIDGRSFGTYRAEWVNMPHHFLVDNTLTACGKAGQSFELMIEAYAGHYFPESPLASCATGPVLPGSYRDPKTEGERAVLGRLTYGIWNEEAYQLFIDMDTLRMLGEQADPESLRADRIAEALEQATLLIDFEQPEEGRLQSYQAARKALKPVLEAHNGSTSPAFYAVGNAHLDLAWLWPMEETFRKTSRTFAAQLRLIEEYPEYKFLQSQPAAYAMCREYYPELYQRIRQAAKKGQWIPEGAMWVEPDTNMTSGESLIRQLIHGKRFFREEFGIDSVVLWLPDTFGYSAALPQLLKGCGVKYLVTQKIFWTYNQADRFPYHYFTWQGADGSQINTFLPTSYTYRTHPEMVCETWRKRVQKRGLDAFLLPYGYGDGGGGPCRDDIEYLRREKDLEGMPRMKSEGPVQFFEDMEKEGDPKNTYVGELYFAAHRGVYTSQAAVKRGNRKSELALREAEMWGTLAAVSDKGYHYPQQRMDAAWKRLLLNQFHDILPGSSIGRVYERAREDFQWIQNEGKAVMEEAFSAMTSGEGVTVFNSLSAVRRGLVVLPERFANGARTLDGEEIPTQKTDDGILALVTAPPCGMVSLVPSEAPVSLRSVCARLTETGAVMENEAVRAVLNRRGEVVSFVDKKTGREFAASAMNRLLAYKDIPRTFDAWDIDSNYAELPVETDEPVSLTLKESGGLRAVLHLERRLLHSDFSQDIVLEAGSRRLDFVTKVNWKELHRLLKVSFPVAVQAEEGINEIQFGYVTRPTHRSRQYDKDRFEVCNQRYSALCDQSHGAAVLNDCKYGVSMNGNELQLSLLRAAASPEMRADNGEHTFTYAFTAWEGSFGDSPVVEEAYRLNVPMGIADGSCRTFSAFQLDKENVWIDTVKPAEDGSGDGIVRLYESKKADTCCTVKTQLAVQKVWLCDMLENPQEEISIEDCTVSLHFHPFEVKTLRMAGKAR